MKRNNLKWALPVVALFLLVVGCSKNDDVATTGTRTITLNCGIGATDSKVATRAGVSYGGTDESKETFIWHAGDKFEAWLISSDNNGFEATKPLFTIDSNYKDSEQKSSATFTCNDFPTDRDYDIVAIYPQAKAKKGLQTEIRCELPNTQTQKGESTKHLADNMFMYATATVPQDGTPTSLTFHHITSLLRFTVKNKNAQDCQLVRIVVTASDYVFGNEIALLNKQIYMTTKTSKLTLETQAEDGNSVRIGAGKSFDGYMVTGTCQSNDGSVVSYESLTGKTLTFTLTVTDADGSNQRTYTSMALDANKIIKANGDFTTWEPGKRYWFDLVLGDQFTVGNVTVTKWGEIAGGNVSNSVMSLTDLCSTDTYKEQREALTTLTLDGSAITSTEVTNYMQGNFATYFPNVTTLNIAGKSLAQIQILMNNTTVTTLIGNNLTSLPENAFNYTSVSNATANYIFPNVETVGGYCFKRSYGAKNISLPKLKAFNQQLLFGVSVENACFASLTDFTNASQEFTTSGINLAFGATTEFDFGTKDPLDLFQNRSTTYAASTTLYLNENGYEYQHADLTNSTWRGVTFKEIKKYSEYTGKKD